MGKKKRAFIDKKASTTFNLVFHDQADDADDDGSIGGGALVPRAPAPLPQQQGPAADGATPSLYDGDYDCYDDDEEGGGSEVGGVPRWAREHEDAGYEMHEERRRELLLLGFPDDGYDYLRHMRDLGRGRARVSTLCVVPTARWWRLALARCVGGGAALVTYIHAAASMHARTLLCVCERVHAMQAALASSGHAAADLPCSMHAARGHLVGAHAAVGSA